LPRSELRSTTGADAGIAETLSTPDGAGRQKFIGGDDTQTPLFFLPARVARFAGEPADF